MKPLLLLLLVLLGACSSSTPQSGDDVPTIDAPMGGTFPAITIGATTGSPMVPVSVDATGSAASPLGAITMFADAGNFQLPGGDGATAFVYATQPFGALTLYQGFAVTPTRWDVFWLYCQGSSLVSVFDESIGDASLFDRGAQGTCNGSPTPGQPAVNLPALALTMSVGVPGFSVEGTGIHVGTDGLGTVDVAGQTLPFAVFSTVDCSQTCGAPGWYELHSVVWDAAHQRAIFGILYLQSAGTVTWEYSRSLPDLAAPLDELAFSATWSVPTP